MEATLQTRKRGNNHLDDHSPPAKKKSKSCSMIACCQKTFIPLLHRSARIFLNFCCPKKQIDDSRNIPLSFVSFTNHKNSTSIDKNFITQGYAVVTKISFCGKDYILKYPSHLTKDSYDESTIYFHNMSLSREIMAYTKINNEHPNIVNFLYGYHEPAPALLLEYYESINLFLYFQQNIPDIKFFISLSLKITDALHFIHTRDILHGDIKAANILFSIGKDKKINFKLCDFGLCFFMPLSKDTKYQINDIVYAKIFRPPEVNDTCFYSNHSMDVYAFGRMIQIYCNQFNIWKKSTDKNDKLLTQMIYHLTSLAVQKTIEKRITAQQWNSYLKQKTPSYLS